MKEKKKKRDRALEHKKIVRLIAKVDSFISPSFTLSFPENREPPSDLWSIWYIRYFSIVHRVTPICLIYVSFIMLPCPASISIFCSLSNSLSHANLVMPQTSLSSPFILWLSIGKATPYSISIHRLDGGFHSSFKGMANMSRILKQYICLSPCEYYSL